MNNEQRLRFEAKHKVPDGVKLSADCQEYISTDFYDEDFVNEARKYNALWQGYQSALEDRQGEAVALYMPKELHARTKDLVARFATALAEKLYRAELKYDYSDGWIEDDWLDECVEKLNEHVAKGDPLDVAAYCAFLWHHDSFTSPQPVQPDQWNELYNWLHKELNSSGALMSMAEDINFRATIKDVIARMESVDSSLALRKGA